MPSVTLIVAAHKAYRMPDDPMYLPVHVGAEGKTDKNGKPLNLGYQKDNVGDNISARNNQFCELTGLYWAWKNLDSDYLGLVHYRRYFTGKNRGKDPFDRILTTEEMQKYLSAGYTVFVPKKRHYYIETLYSHYIHTHYQEELDAAREIVLKQHPEYLEVYDRVMKRTWGYMFNMMILPRNLLDEYCNWLFDILFELANNLVRPNLSDFDNRYVGRVSELLFNVWLEYQLSNGKVKNNEKKELPYIYMEKVDKRKKVVVFLRAKFFHKKQDKSF